MLYSLTHSEAELVRLLSQGNSLEEAAEVRGVSINTIRSHLRNIFLKTDTRRQGDLVRLVLTGVAPLRELSARGNGAGPPPSCAESRPGVL